MRIIKTTRELGGPMFIHAFYLQMKEGFSNVYINLSDMVHCDTPDIYPKG